jgi:adenylate cyclase class 2
MNQQSDKTDEICTAFPSYTPAMQNSEIELKFPVPDPETLQTILPQLGFHLVTPRTFEHNTLYDTPARDLRARRQLLRIRQYGALCTVTHKRQPDQQNPVDITRYKIRIETETIVAEREALAEIFQQLGYAPVFVYEKFRTEWSHAIDPNSEACAHLVIDETPIGNYAELEGPTAWIDETLAALQVDPAACLTDSYGKLFLDWKQRTGSPAENLTFAEVTSPVLIPR